MKISKAILVAVLVLISVVSGTTITEVRWNANQNVIEILFDEFSAPWGDWTMYVDDKEWPMEGGTGNAIVRPNAPIGQATGLLVGTDPWLSSLVGTDFPCCGSIQFSIPGQIPTNRFEYSLVGDGCKTTSTKSCGMATGTDFQARGELERTYRTGSQVGAMPEPIPEPLSEMVSQIGSQVGAMPEPIPQPINKMGYQTGSRSTINIVDVKWIENLKVIEISFDQSIAQWGGWTMYVDGAEWPLEGGTGNAIVRPNAAGEEATGLFIGTDPWLTGLTGVNFPCCGRIQFQIPGQGFTNEYEFSLAENGCLSSSQKLCNSQPGSPVPQPVPIFS